MPEGSTVAEVKTISQLGDARTGKLADNLSGFGRTLRRAGVRVDAARMALAQQAVMLVGLQREDFCAALEAVLVSREQDRLVFRELFDVYFRNPEIAQKLNAESNKALAGEMREKLEPQGILLTPGSIDDFVRFQREDMGAGEVGDVDIVADAGSIGRLVIRPEDFQRRASPVSRHQCQRDQMGFHRMCLADFAAVAVQRLLHQLARARARISGRSDSSRGSITFSSAFKWPNS